MNLHEIRAELAADQPDFAAIREACIELLIMRRLEKSDHAEVLLHYAVAQDTLGRQDKAAPAAGRALQMALHHKRYSVVVAASCQMLVCESRHKTEAELAKALRDIRDCMGMWAPRFGPTASEHQQAEQSYAATCRLLGQPVQPPL